MTSPDNRWLRTRSIAGDDYDARYERAAAAGENVHGEADFVMRYSPASVLDGGCGTGRVARELSRRGVDVVGVDIDPVMLATAQSKAPALPWLLADLATCDIGRAFDLVVLAGNVMIFLTPGSEGQVVANLARHLRAGGRLVAGFQLERERLSLSRYDEVASAAGLELVERYATWDRDDWTAVARYAVSVHRRVD